MMPMRLVWLLLVASMLAPGAAAGEPPPGTVVLATPHSYSTLLDRLDLAVDAAGMVVVARASATIGAAQRGLTIPGNAVVMVFRNDFALRLLAADEAAGIEAPLRFYITEAGDGTARLRYRLPSAVFAAYGAPALVPLAAELDAILAQIAATAVAHAVPRGG